ncbi:class F sortase [Ornithinimicrobium cryptoxanthini]|uniref:Class F sortase n=1 Tax=Ornithinimicrobium cryptoxanthini TaxID=2934161 RepID=A0ABY4YDA4_9MICO|nr:class F sortase [Ornithinimicrobium cryptoxanthini]USQ74756.1 class F sortase [Ornithinimicrobium cryptoxanthini]
MGRATAHRRHRVSLVAVVVTLASLVLVGWAVRGLMQDTVPATADFGSSSVLEPVTGQESVGGNGPSPGADTSTATGSPSPSATPSAAEGSTTPGRSAASLPTVREQALPVRLLVPALDLDMELDAVGVTPDGQMEVPEDPDRAGWYRHGPAPGNDLGSVVLAGHIDDAAGPGPFFRLTEAREGVEVVVELSDGTSTAYRMVGGEQVAKSDLAVDELFRRDGDPVLRLVTCTGDWSPRAGHYTDNLVITAEPVR